MNIENLKCFILVAENLSFARAAEALYIPARRNKTDQHAGTGAWRFAVYPFHPSCGTDPGRNVFLQRREGPGSEIRTCRQPCQKA